jgi:sulfoxide reductase catalytic subunit YedY
LPAALDSFELTPRAAAARYNNFYELSPGGAADLRGLAPDFRTSPWRLEVRGACRRPRTLSLEELYRFPHRERLYHFRCVERWAMNVPWVGFPLWRLLEEVEPTSAARWVVFESAADRRTMPGIAAAPHYPWPYREALLIEEAMNDLTLLATGVYGAPLPRQHGAPVRLVVPWKYGYKNPKSLVKIELVEETPTTFWSRVAPHEYGLLSNVNPNIPHPRWSQELSFWLRDDPVWPTGEDTFPTPIFNGYEEQVAGLYLDEPRVPQRPRLPGEIAR